MRRLMGRVDLPGPVALLMNIVGIAIVVAIGRLLEELVEGWCGGGGGVEPRLREPRLKRRPIELVLRV
jgi:hypothetical protein